MHNDLMKWCGGKILPLFVYCIMEGGIGIMDGRVSWVFQNQNLELNTHEDTILCVYTDFSKKSDDPERFIILLWWFFARVFRSRTLIRIIFPEFVQ
jgi:hypothetical protein